MQQITLELRRAPDDPPAHAPQFQEELREFARSLRRVGGRLCPTGSSWLLASRIRSHSVSRDRRTLRDYPGHLLQNQSGRVIRVVMVNDALTIDSAEDVEGFIEKLKCIQEDKKGEARR